MSENSKKDITLPVAIASYPYVLEPTENQKGEKVYSITFVFPPEAENDLKGIASHIVAVAEEKFGKDKAAKALRSGPYSNPLRKYTDDEAEEKGYPKGGYYLRAKTKNKPDVVTRIKGEGGKPTKLTDPDLLYPGALVRGSVRFFGYDNESKGVGCGLNALQVYDSTTPRLDGKRDGSQLFDADLTDAGDPFAR